MIRLVIVLIAMLIAAPAGAAIYGHDDKATEYSVEHPRHKHRLYYVYNANAIRTKFSKRANHPAHWDRNSKYVRKQYCN